MPPHGPAIALPEDLAQERDRQAKLERTGRQVLDSLACAIYCQLASQHVLECQRAGRLDLLHGLLADASQQAQEAAFPMAAQLGWHFQAAPPAGPEPTAPDRPT